MNERRNERFERMKDSVAVWIAGALPRRIVYWAVIRAGVHATTGKYSKQVVPELGLPDLLKRWREA